MKGRPAHAGRLRRPERCVFIGVFAVMAVLVVGITMSVVRPIPLVFARTAASSRTEEAGQPASSIAGSDSAGSHSAGDQASAGHGKQAGSSLDRGAPDTRLAAALRPAAAICPGHVSVAVRDRTTGAEALQAAGQTYSAMSTAGPDILAVLLYQHQQLRVPLSVTQASLAARMIEHGSRAATARLWRLIGGARGFGAGATALRLSHTSVPAGGWREVVTTAADQLQLLADLTSAASPLAPAARAEEVRLMARAAAGRPLWAAAAASPGTSYAAIGGWHAGLAGGVAIVRHGSQKLIVVVLVQGCGRRAGGLAAVQAAAAAAAALVTSLPPGRASHGPLS